MRALTSLPEPGRTSSLLRQPGGVRDPLTTALSFRAHTAPPVFLSSDAHPIPTATWLRPLFDCPARLVVPCVRRRSSDSHAKPLALLKPVLRLLLCERPTNQRCAPTRTRQLRPPFSHSSGRNNAKEWVPGSLAEGVLDQKRLIQTSLLEEQTQVSVMTIVSALLNPLTGFARKSLFG